MKISALILVLLVVIQAAAGAVEPVTAALIGEAQEYGQRFKNLAVEEFMQPWTALGDKAYRTGGWEEKAYLYTPYLLIALKAREKALAGGKVHLEDSENIITEYTGYLTFEVVMYTAFPVERQMLNAVLKQGKKNVKQYQVVAAQPEPVISLQGNRLYKTQCYIYFPDRDIMMHKPVQLTISSRGERERQFRFNLGELK
ncbi:MAG: hypothetical protein N2491_05480 [Negativicutes bacterium]|nr:hypothetical protein [Negativicutes bacterium]